MDEPVLNVVPITFDSDQIEVGRMSGVDKDGLAGLREKHWDTHAFRYDSRTDEVFNISLVANAQPLGQVGSVPIQEHLLLVARAIQQSILVWLSRKLPFLRSNKRLMFWGQTDNALLLTQAIRKARLEPIPGLEVALRYEIDCRMFGNNEEDLFLGLIIDLATSNILDIPISKLHRDGFLSVGRYVCAHREAEYEYMRPQLDLLGCVSRVDQDILWLTDTEGVTHVTADQAYLEPRQENLYSLIELYFAEKAPDVIDALAGFRNPISTATGKLARIRETLKHLKGRDLCIGNGVKILLGELLTPQNDRFPDQVTTGRPPLLFGAQGLRRHTIPDVGITTYGPYFYMQHKRNSPHIGIICESRFQGRVEQFMKMLCDGFPSEHWKGRRDNPFPDGLLGKYKLSRIHLEYELCENASVTAYRDAINRLLRRTTEPLDLAVVQTQQSFMNQYGDNNPYFVSKATFMTADVPVQCIQIKNIDNSSSGLAYLLNNLALAVYAKLDGTPWVIATRQPTTHELVIGLGATEVSSRRLDTRERYVGITSVFQEDGRYLVWGTTREVEFEDYAEAVLETLRNTIRYVRQHNAWMSGDRVRLICHVYKRLRDCEVEAIKTLVDDLIAEEFQVEYAFLDISWRHPYHLFSPSEPGVDYWVDKVKRLKGKGVPQRGICLQLDKRRGLLHLTGPRELKTMEQGIPKPLLVELHPDSDFTDMTYLLRQIYHFSYMSWRSFFPSSEPVTIAYSRLIARLLGNLRAVNGWNSQVLMGGLRDRRWFL